LAIAGVACGSAGAIGLTRFMKSLLFGIDPADWATLTVACGFLVLVTTAARYIPARRATKIEPLNALRYE
jgi:ABC-type lipoprotein release transport system permease subunit